MSPAVISVIIPARNEERLIGQTLRHVLEAVEHFESEQDDQGDSRRKVNGVCSSDECSENDRQIWEVLVVDNGSTDNTVEIVKEVGDHPQVKVIRLEAAGAARARNAGRQHSNGNVLIFVDADTMIPIDALTRIADHCRTHENVAGITSLGTLDGGFRARCWWGFWNSVRLLPISKAKAMPALMFCTATTFDLHGPFDEEVAIGEEWPILAGLYRTSRSAVIYDRSIVARSSSRRMDQLPFGYTRCFLKYIWAILHRSGRIHYPDAVR